MKLVKVTRYCDEKKVYVNPRNVCTVYPRYQSGSVIQFQCEEISLEVLESVETVAAMIERSEE